MPSSHSRRWITPIVGVCLTSLACPQQRGPGGPTPGNAPPPQITPPPPQAFARLQLNPGALPAGARAHFPRTMAEPSTSRSPPDPKQASLPRTL